VIQLHLWQQKNLIISSGFAIHSADKELGFINTQEKQNLQLLFTVANSSLIVRGRYKTAAGLPLQITYFDACWCLFSEGKKYFKRMIKIVEAEGYKVKFI